MNATRQRRHGERKADAVLLLEGGSPACAALDARPAERLNDASPGLRPIVVAPLTPRSCA
jgi:hypothetical protein